MCRACRSTLDRVSGPKNRPFRDLVSRIALPKAAEREEGFEEAVGPVERLDQNRRRVAPPPSGRAREVGDPHFVTRHEDDQVAAWREDEPPPAQGLEPAPSSTLDLHGLDELEARRAVQRFIVKRAKRGDEHVLVIVGKGRRSPGGHGVLRLAMVDWLIQRPCAQHVAAFRSASATRGGSGAIWVRLVKRR